VILHRESLANSPASQDQGPRSNKRNYRKMGSAPILRHPTRHTCQNRSSGVMHTSIRRRSRIPGGSKGLHAQATAARGNVNLKNRQLRTATVNSHHSNLNRLVTESHGGKVSEAIFRFPILMFTFSCCRALCQPARSYVSTPVISMRGTGFESSLGELDFDLSTK
jgi:hypothetical protein